ncbi:MAG TPA: hypothetical protein VEA59_00185 [Patescibacteria group bacterium]|nr:hypothetical protein [Patescibacteria group bacterium]
MPADPDIKLVKTNMHEDTLCHDGKHVRMDGSGSISSDATACDCDNRWRERQPPVRLEKKQFQRLMSAKIPG